MTTTLILPLFEQKIDVEVEVDFTYAPGVDGVYNALPENCYPDEPPYVEIDRVMLGGVDLLPNLPPETLEEMGSEILDLMEADDEDTDETDPRYPW